MGHVRRSKSACQSLACSDRQVAAMATLCPGNRKARCSATLGVILFCLITLLGSPARGQPEFDDRLAPQDTVEVQVSRWTALRGGRAEASALGNTLTVGAAGTLDFAIIDQVPAAGLRASELEKLITDRLQARSGFHVRPVTTVTTDQRKKHPPFDETGSFERSSLSQTGSAPAFTDSSSAAASERGYVEGRRPMAQPGSTGPRAPAGPAATEQQKALERERSRAIALLREIAATRMEAEAPRNELVVGPEAAHYEALRFDQLITAERQSTATLTQQLSAVRADLEEAKAQLAQNAKATTQARQAAEALANNDHELPASERANGAALEQNILAALREIDALKNSVQSIGEREEALRRELAAAREQLDATRHAANVASAQARAVADMTAKQEQAARKEQRQRAEGLARDLMLAQREVESMKAKAILAMRERAAMHSARHSAEAALAEARRAVDEERHKIGLYARDLDAARQSIDALEARLNLAAAAESTARQGRQVAEAAAKRAGEALVLGRERADSVARALDTARQERDAAKDEVSRVSAAQRKALEQERDRAVALGRDLDAARKEIDILKARGERPNARNEHGPKARGTDRATPRTGVRSARKSGLREIRKVEERKPLRTVRSTTTVLPDALLPTQPPIRGHRQ